MTPTDPRWNALRNYKTSSNGTVSGSWEDNKKAQKHSSFYPRDILDQKQLLSSIQKAERTPYKSEQSPNLFLLKNESSELYIEAFRNPANFAVFKSAYPIFSLIHADELASKSSIEITKADQFNPSGISKTPAEIQQAIKNFHTQRVIDKKTDTPFSYTSVLTNTALIDIAPHLDVGVPKGILVEVPLLPEKAEKASAGAAAAALMANLTLHQKGGN
jgi:hypothetical protein